jgi:arginyl-tRNA synthetase
MQKILDCLSEELAKAFTEAGYDASYAKATLSNRPDLCEYQCNGAMAAAKAYRKAPFMIADDVVAKLQDSEMIEKIESVKPGFININLSKDFLAEYMNRMAEDDRAGCDLVEKPQTIIMDYGGPNVAKPLHVGHLRSAVIGESLKRICRYMGHNVIGDVHLGDWGLQMGLIITELKKRKPELVYFDESYTGEYPEEAPFTISELEEIYPTASAYSKEHPEYKDEAMEATKLLQNGHRGYQGILKHILEVSVSDLKENYKKLNVTFDLWKGESDAQPFIPAMVEMMKEKGYAYYDQGALVVDVKEETDSKEIPPCMILKSDGAALYDTTDLATMVDRMESYHPDAMIYLADKRQELHFVQCFRCAKKTGIVEPDTRLEFIGFGTMNGKDGKPFKTRQGGVMRLENLINEISDAMYEKIMDNRTVSEEEGRKTANIVGLAALKYGDLSNQASKDYIFDVDRFISFEGNTGPYILYTIVRIKSILKKYMENADAVAGAEILAPINESEKNLMMEIAKFNQTIETAMEDLAPHKICAYVYEVSNAFNKFYHENKILGEENKERQASWISLLGLTRKVLEQCIDLLGFEAPDRM